MDKKTTVMELVKCECGYLDTKDQFIGNGNKCCDCDSPNVANIGFYNVDDEYFDGYYLRECVDLEVDRMPDGA